MREMKIRFPKLYRYDRPKEHCQTAIPFAEGVLKDENRVQVYQEGHLMPSQKKVTSRYADGSIRYLFLRFLADLPGNGGTSLEAVFDTKERYAGEYPELTVEASGNGYEINAGGDGVKFAVSHCARTVFDWLEDGHKKYTAGQFVGPLLEDGEGNRYGIRLGEWQALETEPERRRP